MRKADREITDSGKILSFIDGCSTIRVGMFDEKYPYIVPLSFGWEQKDGITVLYFHCAKEGKKIDLLTNNGCVCVEADDFGGYVKTAHGVTSDYQSVIAFGRAEEVSGLEAVHGLRLLLEHCGIEGYDPEKCMAMGIVSVYKITVEQMTCKKRFID